MNKEELSLEEQVERIRKKRSGRHDSTQVRAILNALFLVLAAIGLAMYFFGGEKHMPALVVIAIGMVFKVIEFVLRIM